MILKIGEEGSTRKMMIRKSLLLLNLVYIGVILKVREIIIESKKMN